MAIPAKSSCETGYLASGMTTAFGFTMMLSKVLMNVSNRKKEIGKCIKAMRLERNEDMGLTEKLFYAGCGAIWVYLIVQLVG